MEDARYNKLMMVCKNCEFKEETDNKVVYRNEMIASSQSKLELVDTALVGDPTLPRTDQANCPNCGEHVAVFFMSGQSQGTDSDMALIFICTACTHKWVG